MSAQKVMVSMKTCLDVVSLGMDVFLIPFSPLLQPPTGTDTMVKSGVSTNINTKHQCITAMKEYESKSLEVSR